MAKFRKLLVTGAMGLMLLVPLPAQAAIPVIDDNNILQQIKTYTQTVEVVKNTAQQIQNQLRELQALPKQILDTYHSAVKNSMAKVSEILQDSGFFLDDTHWQEIWAGMYPSIETGDYKQTTWNERSVNTTMQETLSMLNKQHVEDYHALMQELEKSKERLKELMELNKSPEGNKQAQQIANEIAAEKAHIESIQTAVQAITAKNETMKRQVEVMERKNHEAVVQAAKEAEDKALTEMRESTTASVPKIDDPWQTYGRVRW